MYTHMHTHTRSDEGEGEEEDLVGVAEQDFWTAVAQEQKEIDGRERKRQEAMLPKGHHTPIPEEGAEVMAEEREVCC